ncbi:Fe-only nitrogenase accessory AnfO family protein [Clostridium intestinale]|uniref:Fe-only nitrogenase accessory protein AnfO n=1 Tax=Clostridium intestinale DSM 6191 TaxID=1121320 RepID=A0A1M6E1K9_9CLOT|nr:Fe-only nitrogenase accessory AnfO family protein [Clostridium intestinale]SHI79289.1 Fe-only nitrogenase accessory protein AnfO [Clostridium intestinale DSM 6191]
MKIAVLVNEYEKSISSLEDGIIKVYSKDSSGAWEVEKELSYRINNQSSTVALHKMMAEILEDLGECRNFAALEIKGMLFTFLDGYNFNMWRMSGAPEEFLDYIYEKEKEIAISTPEVVPNMLPIDMGDGCYFIDLKKAIENDEKTTSKKILLPFLRNSSFKNLKIFCDHIPRWFKSEFDNLNLSFNQEESNKGIEVTVYHN